MAKHGKAYADATQRFDADHPHPPAEAIELG